MQSQPVDYHNFRHWPTIGLDDEQIFERLCNLLISGDVICTRFSQLSNLGRRYPKIQYRRFPSRAATESASRALLTNLSLWVAQEGDKLFPTGSRAFTESAKKQKLSRWVKTAENRLGTYIAEHVAPGSCTYLMAVTEEQYKRLCQTYYASENAPRREALELGPPESRATQLTAPQNSYQNTVANVGNIHTLPPTINPSKPYPVPMTLQNVPSFSIHAPPVYGPRRDNWDSQSDQNPPRGTTTSYNSPYQTAQGYSAIPGVVMGSDAGSNDLQNLEYSFNPSTAELVPTHGARIEAESSRMASGANDPVTTYGEHYLDETLEPQAMTDDNYDTTPAKGKDIARPSAQTRAPVTYSTSGYTGFSTPVTTTPGSPYQPSPHFWEVSRSEPPQLSPRYAPVSPLSPSEEGTLDSLGPLTISEERTLDSRDRNVPQTRESDAGRRARGRGRGSER